MVILESAGGWACGRAGANSWFPDDNLSLLRRLIPYPKLVVWVAYVKKQLGIATQVSVIKVNVSGSLFLKTENPFPLNNLSVHSLTVTKLSILVIHIKRQFGIASHVSVIMVMTMLNIFNAIMN